ncbi:class III extradiol dioxygenase subunit B-like domain-containing protein [Streptomyces sp. enrichment culture]|uniref:class III extradiol dioxygenase subunit B-like domain-containing protein n=1 Tax=Streptomyces sp. enrichment culture TaxID=1795815 RepID=UPI003F563F7A
MLVAAAVCPCPPLLVPEIAAGAAPELDAARAACADAIGVLAAARPDLLVVVGPTEDAGPELFPGGTQGSFRGFGVGLDVRLGARADGDGSAGALPDAGGRELPPALSVGAWLLSRSGWAGARVEGLGVGEPLAPEQCADRGSEIGARAERVALLVMGDASACRTLKAPGYLDERAAPFDAGVARALETADTAALRALDPVLARELKVSGRAPWQVLAGAAENAGLEGALLYDDAPYGVGYLVATWS